MSLPKILVADILADDIEYGPATPVGINQASS